MIFFIFFQFLIFLIPAHTGNRISTLCLQKDKLLEIFIRWIMTFIEIRCMYNFSLTQKITKIQKIKEEVICRINPANSALFAGLIQQIVPDYKNLRSCKDTYGPVRYWSDKSRVTRQEWQAKNDKSGVKSQEWKVKSTKSIVTSQ